ncbi:MAG: glycoside hydrolase family 3 protein [Rectinemataceae bacterium]
MKDIRLSLRDKIGQMLVVGFPGEESGVDQLRKVLDVAKAGSIVLFSRNIGSAPDLHALISRVDDIVLAATGIRPLISVDQEGGTVARVKRGVTPIPGAMAQAAAFESGAVSIEDIRSLGRVCGSELRALGFSWNLAPVADVNSNPGNPVIGVRSYGADPNTVATLACAFAEGLAEAGILAAAKHFPGHGDTEVDSHLGLPAIAHDCSRIDEVELLPFRRLIEGGIPAVMTAHVQFPAIEPDGLPATLSPRVILGLLRGKLGFKGLVCTDCLEMKAIADNFPDAAVLAVKAGADLLIVSHTADAQIAAAESLYGAVVSGEIDESRIDESLERILAAKARLPSLLSWSEASKLLARPESFELAARVSAASLTVVCEGTGLPPAPGSLYVDIAAQADTGVEDGEAFASVSQALRARGVPITAVRTGVDPSETQIAAAVEQAETAFARDSGSGIVIGYYDAKRHPGQGEMVRRLARAAASHGRACGLVSMKSPYDAQAMAALVIASGAPAPAVLCAYEYGTLAAASVADFISGKIRACGRLPTEAHPRHGSRICKEASA